MTDRRIAKRFTALATLEDGKLGTLYLARDLSHGGHALVLMAAAGTRADAGTLQAIVEDQRAGPHLLPTTDWGLDDDGPWLATAVAAGEAAGTLDGVLKRRDRLELGHVLRAAVALSRAVEQLAAENRQHLAIEPSRVWLASGALGDGMPQLFGVGWWRLLPAYQNGAQPDAFYGNPEFLAAELCKGLPATATADVYGAATTLWALAAGKPPFPSNQPLMALKRQALEKPLRLDLVKPTLVGVKDLQAVVADALDKDPSKRPTAAHWRASIEALAGQKAAAALQQSPALAVLSAATPASATPSAPPTAAFASPATPASPETPASAQPASPTAAPAPAPVPEQAARDALAAVVAAAEPAPVAAADLASLPDGPVQDDEDGDGGDGDGAGTASGDDAGQRGGKRRRARRERQTVAGIGIAAALAESNLREQLGEDAALGGGRGPSGSGSAGTPSGLPILVGMQRPDSASHSPLPVLDGGALRATAPQGPSPTTPVSAVPPRPDSQGTPRVIVRPITASHPVLPTPAATPLTPQAQPPAASPAARAPSEPFAVATAPSKAAGARTGRSLTVQIAEGAFFDDDPTAAPPTADLADLPPPTPPAERLNRGALVAIGGFATLMLGVSLWMTTRTAPQDPPAAPAAAAESAEAVGEGSDATPAAAAEVTPSTAAAPTALPVAFAPTPVTAAAVAAVGAAAGAAPDAGTPAAADAVAAAALPAAVAPPAFAPVPGGGDAGARPEIAAKAAAVPAPTPTLVPISAGRQAEVQALVDEGHSALMTKDPVTALAKAQQALAINAGHAPAVLLREQAQRAVDAALAEAKAMETKVDPVWAAKKAAEEERAQKAAAKNELLARQKAAARGAAAVKAARAEQAREAAAAKAEQARARAAAKRAQKEAALRAQKVAERPVEKVVERPADEGGSSLQEASKFAALAQKASKAKLKVLYLQKAVKLDPGNGGYKSQLKVAEEQLKAEGP